MLLLLSLTLSLSLLYRFSSLDLDLPHRRVRPALPLRPTYRVPLFLYLSRLFPRVECRSSFEHENGKARCGSAAASETNKGINHHHHHHHHRHRRSGTGSTGTTITTAPPPPHHPGLAIAEQFLVFSSEGLPFSKCAAALRVRPIFLCEIRKEPEPAVKKRISGRCYASKSAAYAR